MPPVNKSRGEWADYERSYSAAKQNIYNTLWKIDYYILKASKTTEDFFYLMNKVQIKDLSIFVIKAYLEK